MIETTLQIEPHIDAQLRIAPVAWLGAVRPDGAPHTVPGWFFWDGDSFLLFSQPNDQKLTNLRHSLKVTLGIPLNPDASSVAIFHGDAELVDGQAQEALADAFVTKYREGIDAYGWDAAEIAHQYSVPIRIRPTRLISW